MSLGPVNSNLNASRLSQTLRTQAQETARTEAQQPTTPSTELHGEAPVAPAVDPAIQAGAREATRGAEDAIRSRLEQIMDGPAGGAPRRGLGGSGSNPLEGEQFVNRRTGKGRRRAAVEPQTGIERPQLARQASEAPATSLPEPFDMAGKRTTSGTRLGAIDTGTVPGLPGSNDPPTGIA